MPTWAPTAEKVLPFFYTLHPIALCLCVIAFFYTVITLIKLTLKYKTSVYLLDFACFQPEDSLKCNYELSEYFTRKIKSFTLPSIEFQRKIFIRSGLGEETYIPPFIFEDDISRTSNFLEAWKEAELVMFGCVDELLAKTGIHPTQIGILITNCSLYSPAPSLSAMLVNKYKMREGIKSFHLGGMGCSASVVACAMARNLLMVHPNEYALIVSTESITNNWYFGNQKPMLVTNCLFRLGCAAVLLTNKEEERIRSKYEMLQWVRTHRAARDKAYQCAFQMEDREGLRAVELSKELMGVAAGALRANIVRLGPSILPMKEQLHFLFTFLCRNVLNMQMKQYQPDFKLAVQHFCLHAGGRAVIDEIQKNLYLREEHVEPSRATLHRFGNTSASNVWYVLAYMEAKRRVKRGEKVWMLGLGSGFKCNSLILKALLDIPLPSKSPWLDTIHRYPATMFLRRPSP